MHNRKCSAAAIALTLGKHRSTICRELKRNTDPGTYYYERHAQAKARRRRKAAKAKSLMIENNPDLERFLLGRFAQRHSPEQIVGRMRVTEYWYQVCQRTIYRWVHRDWQGRKNLLRFQGRPRVPYGERKNFWQPHKRHISERPRVVERKRRVGDWEADLVHGTKDDSRHCLLTINDRMTNDVIIRKIQTLKPAIVARHFEIALRGLPVHTITVDNGIEFGHHKTIEKLLKCKVYFTDPNSPQQRGANENINGLIRQYFPKGKSLKHVTQLEASLVALDLNRRPRKRLNFHTPARVFAKYSGIPEARVLYRLR
jgi:IS30 family transposase